MGLEDACVWPAALVCREPKPRSGVGGRRKDNENKRRERTQVAAGRPISS